MKQHGLTSLGSLYGARMFALYERGRVFLLNEQGRARVMVIAGFLTRWAFGPAAVATSVCLSRRGAYGSLPAQHLARTDPPIAAGLSMNFLALSHAPPGWCQDGRVVLQSFRPSGRTLLATASESARYTPDDGVTIFRRPGDVLPWFLA